jgi:Flp pilus assembly pilin Flp
VRDYLKSERGATTAEYALIMVVIGSAVALAVVGLRSSIGVAVNGAGQMVASVDGPSASLDPTGTAGSPEAPTSTGTPIPPATGDDPCKKVKKNGGC